MHLDLMVGELLMSLVLELDQIFYSSYWTGDIYLACIISLILLFTHTHTHYIFYVDVDVYLYVDGDVYISLG